MLSILFLCREVFLIAKATNNQLINENIKFEQVRLINAEGAMVGVVPIAEALKQAKEAELDLVCISANPENPVCRVMDFGKYVFDQGKREKEAKKNRPKRGCICIVKHRFIA